MRSIRSRHRSLTAASLALVLALPAVTAAAAPVTGAPADIATAGAGPTAWPQVSQVSLVTGERVRIERYAGGHQGVTIEAQRPGISYETMEHEDGQLYVLPSDAAPLVGELLDEELFNVTRLREYGYTGEVPVITTYTGPAAMGRASTAGATTTATLDSIDAVAATVDGSGTWWTSMRSNAPTAAAAGVQRVWLDRQVQAQLDDSVPQVGAPAAWQAGYDGTGLTVAVLDTGIRADHPDLAGRVVAAENFSDADSADDQHGHGTHVAGIVASQGVAVDGSYGGVAPGVELMNGKVLDDTGSGTGSMVIAGMEWAAQHGADVVNMSLGACCSDGTDPMSQAVNQLTEQHDLLFVISAGNDGTSGISTPGAADAALTIGSVSKQDELASTSGRGPRAGDHAIKPDLTAPGVDIVSARAEGTEVPGAVHVGEHHTQISGTSMAAPHVAAAAAMTLQRDPDLSAGELKAALAGTGAVHNEYTVYEQGGGRLELPAALDVPVLVTPAPLQLGSFAHPHDDAEPVTVPVSVANRGDDPLELDLSLQVENEAGQAPGEQVLSVSPATLQVDPGQTGQATVTLDVADSELGLFGGHLRASSDGEVITRTPVGFYLEPPLYDLTIEGIARDGRPAGDSSRVDVLDVHDMSRFRDNGYYDDGTVSFRVPPGTYHVTSMISTYDGDDVTRQDRSLIGHPELEIDSDTTLVLDARDADPISIDTPAHDEAAPFGTSRIGFYRAAEKVGSLSYGLLGEWIPTYAAGTDPVTVGRFEFNTRTRLGDPPLALSVTDPVSQQLAARPMRDSPPLDDDVELPLVWAGAGNPGDYDGLDVTGAIVLTVRGDPFPIDASKVRNAQRRGAAALVSMNDVSGRYNSWAGNDPQIPAMTISQEEGQQLRTLLEDGEVTMRLRGTRASTYLYDLVLAEPGRIPDELHHVADPADLATVVNNFHGGVADHETREVRHYWRPFETTSFGTRSELLIPLERTEYLVPGDTRYRQAISAAPTSVGVMNELQTFYEPGEQRAQSWFESPVRPGVFEGNEHQAGEPAVRDGDMLRLALPEWVDSQPGHWGSRHTDVDTSAFRLYRDGQLLTQAPRAIGEFPLSPEPAEYRLELDVARDASWWTTSTETRTAWTVQSQRPADGAAQRLPLLQVDVDAELDLRNTAARRHLSAIPLQVRHQDGADTAPVHRMRVWLSYDDGQSWRVQPVLPGGDGEFVLLAVPPPRDAEHVSLRVDAADADGNRIEQEVLRAWWLP